MSYNRAKEVVERNRDVIRERYRSVQGTGIGAFDDSVTDASGQGENFAIHVYVLSLADVPESPQAIDGVPLVFKVSGKFSVLPVR
ncbi:hypothetical protein SRB5_62180 [Streptomyces sp. RB5]|uniref:Uncharacterized protein n=1 Tax=Streptomyces smaragdinus TaxID=2585196 RepID=A0A7K0CRB3_9ACTN|nr:hypothetical protein [Streptomyces smaragdinus]MQY16026.1 hypothetical protein [Streptomyces smaragdinus]